MKLLQVSALNTLNEMTRVCNENSREDTLGYFVSNQVIVLQPKFMCEPQYNEDYMRRVGLPILEIPAKGGTIVCNAGDIGFLYVTDDLYSNWNLPAMKYLAHYLQTIYGIDVIVHHNDLLADFKKFVGTASGFYRNKHIYTMFVSMNDTTTWLIDKICTKKTNYRGFVGLDKYGVCPKRLINTIINFSRHWERRAIEWSKKRSF